jgi:hypothetical protein
VLDRPEQFDPATLRRYCLERFGTAAVTRQLAALYNEVLDGAGLTAVPAPAAGRAPRLSSS